MPARHTRSLLGLAGPMFAAQLAVVVNGVADTVMTGHYSAEHLGAIGVGVSAWVIVFVTLMNAVHGASPVIARHFGAGEHRAIGAVARQSVLLALALSLPGTWLLNHPEPLFALVQVPGEVAHLAARYLAAMAWGLPAALLGRVFYTLSPAVGRPRPVLLVNLGMLAVKLPLSWALIYGRLGLPEMGAVGCGVASAVAFWVMAAGAFAVLRGVPFYRRFEVFGGSWMPRARILGGILRIGLPTAGTSLVDVTGFVFMALFVARLGATVVAAHQVVANLAVVLFMLPLNLGIAVQILIGQALGRREPGHARSISAEGLALGAAIGAAGAVAIAGFPGAIAALYTDDADVRALAVALAGLVAVYHFFDAVQVVAVNALRGYHHAFVPMLIYVFALWGVGLGGGWWLAFRGLALAPIGLDVAAQGVRGMWLGAAAAITLEAVALVAYLRAVSRRDGGPARVGEAAA